MYHYQLHRRVPIHVHPIQQRSHPIRQHLHWHPHLQRRHPHDFDDRRLVLVQQLPQLLLG